jgi:hypothetical protein
LSEKEQSPNLGKTETIRNNFVMLPCSGIETGGDCIISYM